MGTAERRSRILKLLLKRRNETITNLADEFGVSERTIRRDIEILSLDAPLYTQCGRYGGGVYVVEGYYPDKPYISAGESELLYKLIDMAASKKICSLSESETVMLCAMAKTYSRQKT